MEVRDRTVNGIAGDYAPQPAEYEFYYAPPSSWTLNRPVTPGAPNSLSQGLQHVVQQTPPPLPTVTPSAPNRARKRARKRNVDATPEKDNEVTKAKPSKKKTRSSANKKRPNKSDSSKTVDNTRATKPDAPADQSHVLPSVDSGDPCNTESNTDPNLESRASAELPNSESITKTSKQMGSKAHLSKVGLIDHAHEVQHPSRVEHLSIPAQTAKPIIDVAYNATSLDTADDRSDTIENCAEYDELFNSLLDDTPNSSVTFSGSRANSNSTYPSPSIWSTQDVKTGNSDFENTAHTLSSPSTAGPDSRMHATGADPGSITFLDEANPSGPQNHLRKFTSPVTPKTTADCAEVDRKPIVRFPFPPPVCNRSPIIGLSPALLLRTCFRIGEAINQASHATKNRQRVMFELYARIMDSHRDEEKQDFIFCDLFHEKPPHLRGIYSAAIWKDVDLYRYDGGRLLTKDRMCRCIGEIKRDGKEWVMTVSNIWEATWEDIEWVEGIVNAV
ncbi:hypothetical protein DM02DRAFT_612679 [Periconia macrospinosa]|uniref:Uncharacterized protein n=1 Tax=Periconia macrospinosa TaxID=97972 RepID=A0A2V1DZR5_9PLEO|nr:hypothetical protein DM02DRAFT_612679 [Periconia macrospinosa]